MSVSSTLALKVAETGPIFVFTTAAKPLSPLFSRDSQPGMQDLSTSGSLSNPQTFGRSAGKVTSPVIVMAMNASLLRGFDRPASSSTSVSDAPAALRNAEDYQDVVESLHWERRNCTSIRIVVSSNDLARRHDIFD